MRSCGPSIVSCSDRPNKETRCRYPELGFSIIRERHISPRGLKDAKPMALTFQAGQRPPGKQHGRGRGHKNASQVPGARQEAVHSDEAPRGLKAAVRRGRRSPQLSTGLIFNVPSPVPREPSGPVLVPSQPRREHHGDKTRLVVTLPRQGTPEQ